MIEILYINNILTESIVDGPGLRITIFLQGCIHECKGCHNPQTWNLYSGGYDITVDDLVVEIVKRFTPLHQGITFSGGEPLLQSLKLLKFIESLKKIITFDTVLYTGYLYEHVHNDKLLEHVDILIDGPFILEKRDISLQWRGSSNQRIIYLKNGEKI